MNKSVLQTPKGFRDFLPEQKRARDFVMGKIKTTFELFGFEPLETPTVEYASVLLGKYGQEADKLVYTFKDRGGRQLALRYDQTVPSARVLAQYQNKLPRFFRRYQLQNVFRADKPQKGRFREFTQCDIDIFGSISPVADAEIIACTYFSFKSLGFSKIVIKINDRQTLFTTLKPYASKKLPLLSIIQTIDKLDKKPPAEVTKELIKKGLTSTQAKSTLKTISQAKLSPALQSIINAAQQLGVPQKTFVFSPFLARGLDYYTGMIFEVILPQYDLGSFGGGGRYDQLIKNLSGVDMPAVGIAFGFDRIVEAASNLNLIPKNNRNIKVLITLFDSSATKTSLETAAKLRQQQIPTQIYASSESLPKQLKYANQQNIPYVLIIGPDEIKQNKFTLKNMVTGDQQTLTLKTVIQKLK